MLTPHRIDRLLAAARDGQLLDEVLANGRPLPLSARLLLSRPESQAVVAPALALIRRLELTPTLDQGGLALFQRVVQVDADRLDPLAAAATLAALRHAEAALTHTLEPLPSGDPGATGGLSDAIDRARHTLEIAAGSDRARGGCGLLGAGEDGALLSALAVWLLSDAPGGVTADQTAGLRRALIHAAPLPIPAERVLAHALMGREARIAA